MPELEFRGLVGFHGLGVIELEIYKYQCDETHLSAGDELVWPEFNAGVSTVLCSEKMFGMGMHKLG